MSKEQRVEAPERIRVHSSVLFQVDDDGEPFTAEYISTEEEDSTGFVTEYVRAPVAQPLNDVQADEPFQARVRPWMLACFGAEIASNKDERNHRFLEEALELVQSCGTTNSEAHQLVDYVFNRSVDPPQREVGGVMVTLAALCLTQGFDMQACAEAELNRVWGKIDVIRAKQAAKPKHSPLPEHVTATPVQASVPVEQDHIAWLRYVNHGQYEDSGADIITIQVCDSDAPGAFKVYAQASVPVEPKSNRDPHPFQEHPLYPNYCAFAVGDEDYCKRETDNVIHQVATPSPTAPASVPVAQPADDKLVTKIVDAVYRSMKQYDDQTWWLDQLQAKARVRLILRGRPSQSHRRGTVEQLDGSVATFYPPAPASVPVAQPPTADAQMVALEIVKSLYNINCFECSDVFCAHWQSEAASIIYDALPAAEQRGRDEQREKDARRCEDLVTYTEDHGGQEPCYWCKALEVAAIVIRSNQ